MLNEEQINEVIDFFEKKSNSLIVNSEVMKAEFKRNPSNELLTQIINIDVGISQMRGVAVGLNMVKQDLNVDDLIAHDENSKQRFDEENSDVSKTSEENSNEINSGV